MIIIVLFLFIAAVVIALNMYDSSNLSKIEKYLEKQNCTNLVYSRGSYKAICPTNITQIENSFTLDLEKNTKKYFYKDIKDIKINKLDILVNNQSKISFKEESQISKFYEILDKKIID